MLKSQKTTIVIKPLQTNKVYTEANSATLNVKK